MISLNETILPKGVKEPGQWLGKVMSKDVIEKFYRSGLKEPKDPKYSATMKIKVSPVSPPEVCSQNGEKSGVGLCGPGVAIITH